MSCGSNGEGKIKSRCFVEKDLIQQLDYPLSRETATPVDLALAIGNSNGKVEAVDFMHSFARPTYHQVNHHVTKPNQNFGLQASGNIPYTLGTYYNSIELTKDYSCLYPLYSTSVPFNCTGKNEIKRCLSCNKESTPLWRNGPMGYKTLCNACGLRYRKEIKRMNENGWKNDMKHGDDAMK